MRFFIDISYDGSDFHGWQKQPNAKTVQQTIENSMSVLLKEPIEIVGAGRTDTGVHAKQLIAHFDSKNDIDKKNLLYKLNSFLPKTIAINAIDQVKNNAHARFDAVSRAYVYKIHLEKNPFLIHYSYYLKYPVDLDAMDRASTVLKEYTDFKCFSKSKTDVKTYNCYISSIKWEKTGNEIKFFIVADRFLRNMVRAIVGTLLEIGIGKLKEQDLHTIVESRDRSKAGYSVPAKGLYLHTIEYPKSIYI